MAHATVVLVVFVVFATSVFANSQGLSADFFIDPFGLKAETQNSELGDMQIASTVAEVFGSQVSQDAASVISQKMTAYLPISGSENFLAKPVLATTSIPENRKRTTVTNYTVENGDTLWSIAVKFDITTDTILWANNITDEDLVKPGQSLVILPVPGVLHTVRAGDTAKSIASKYSANADDIVSFNDLEDGQLTIGSKIIVPDGQIAEEAKPAVTTRTPSYQQAAPRVRIAPSYGGPNNFPWGYCTWWVASRRYVPWNGNAWQWYYNAQAMGYATGRTPVPGAIMVTWESPIGHVAYVESVSGSTFTVSEMNYQGYGIASRRTLTTGSVPLIGFIY